MLVRVPWGCTIWYLDVDTPDPAAIDITRGGHPVSDEGRNLNFGDLDATNEQPLYIQSIVLESGFTLEKGQSRMTMPDLVNFH